MSETVDHNPVVPIPVHGKFPLVLPGETVEQAKERILAQFAEIEAIPDATDDPVQSAAASALDTVFFGETLGTWLLRLKAIFETSYAGTPSVNAVKHTPPS